VHHGHQVVDLRPVAGHVDGEPEAVLGLIHAWLP
jgi:hypothetical protein